MRTTKGMNEDTGLIGLRQFVKWVKQGLILVCIILVLIVAKLTYQAESHFRKAEQAVTEQDWKEAVWQYQWALRSYVPGLPVNRQAVTRLEDLAAQWNAAGNTEQGLDALQTLRAALYSIRSLYQPFPEALLRTEEAIQAIQRQSAPEIESATGEIR